MTRKPPSPKTLNFTRLPLHSAIFWPDTFASATTKVAKTTKSHLGGQTLCAKLGVRNTQASSHADNLPVTRPHNCAKLMKQVVKSPTSV